MGVLCCSPSLVKKPIVDEKGKQHGKFRENADVVHCAPVQFDVVVPDTPLVFKERFDVNGSMATFDQTMYTMREASLCSPRRNSAIITGLDQSTLSLTNYYTDVDEDAVQRFVNNIANFSKSTVLTPLLERSMVGASPAAIESAASTLGSLTENQQAYVMQGKSRYEQLLRFMEVEEMSRQEIFGAWHTNTLLLTLAAKRVVPTLRLRQMRNLSKKPTLVIHAQEMHVDMEAGNSPRASTEALIYSPLHDTGDMGHRDAFTWDGAGGSSQATTPRLDDLITDGSHAVASGSAYFQGSAERSTHSRQSPLPSKVEHYELLALTGRDIKLPSHVNAMVVHDTWNFLSLDDSTKVFNSGNCYFRFMCSPVPSMDRETLDLINVFINHTSFKDEVLENNAPKVNVFDPEDAAKYIGILVKAMYLLPGVKMANINADLIGSLEYQKSCQPFESKFEDLGRPDAFRFNLTIVKFIFSLTIQFKVSQITDPNVLYSFKDVDGIVPAKAIMLERTKRNLAKTDTTAKVRSMLLYYPVSDGVLVNNQTIVMNTSLPKVVSKIVNTFGSQGAAQSAQTAKLTRAYLINRFGDSRSS